MSGYCQISGIYLVISKLIVSIVLHAKILSLIFLPRNKFAILSGSFKIIISALKSQMKQFIVEILYSVVNHLITFALLR